MDFKNLGENSIIYIIRKKPFEYLTGTLKSKVAKQQNPYNLQQVPQTFDVVINVNGNDEIVPGVADNMEVIDYKGSFYSATVEGILQANANLAQIAKAGKEEQSYYDSVLDGTEQVNEMLNPRYAEEKQRDRTIKELVEHRKETDSKLDQILSFMKELASPSKK